MSRRQVSSFVIRHSPFPRQRAAFTLIELLLVLVILAVLAAVVIPKFTGRAQDARITAAKVDIKNISTALSAFEVDNGRFPTTDEGLDALVHQPANLESWKRPYLEGSLPKDPWGSTYIYQSPGTHRTADYDLFSPGPDKNEGTPDDITNWESEK